MMMKQVPHVDIAGLIDCIPMTQVSLATWFMLSASLVVGAMQIE